jgi:hypothetical protein
VPREGDLQVISVKSRYNAFEGSQTIARAADDLVDELGLATDEQLRDLRNVLLTVGINYLAGEADNVGAAIEHGFADEHDDGEGLLLDRLRRAFA